MTKAGDMVISLYRYMFIGLILSVAGAVTAKDPATRVHSPHSKQCKHEVFTNKMMADGQADDGTLVGYTAFETEDGTKVQSLDGDFGSPEKAKAEIERRIKHATKIIQRSFESNRNAQKEGERVEMTLPTQVPNHFEFVVAWTSGSYLHEVSSECPEAALALEKKLKR